jgi:hypothetical protein
MQSNYIFSDAFVWGNKHFSTHKTLNFVYKVKFRFLISFPLPVVCFIKSHFIITFKWVPSVPFRHKKNKVNIFLFNIVHVCLDVSLSHFSRNTFHSHSLFLFFFQIHPEKTKNFNNRNLFVWILNKIKNNLQLVKYDGSAIRVQVFGTNTFFIAHIMSEWVRERDFSIPIFLCIDFARKAIHTQKICMLLKATNPKKMRSILQN